MISQYHGIAPKGDLLLLQKLAGRLEKKKFLHINSTREGGGVAEILQRMVPLMREMGIDTRWETITGDAAFFGMTKKVHNALQGQAEDLSAEMWDYHLEVNRKNAETLDLEADAVLIHDPQPAPLIAFRKNGAWIWRCHIDVSTPQKETWNLMRRYLERYNAAIFSISGFAQPMRLAEFIVPPSIDPVSEKNRELTPTEIQETAEKYRLPRDRPVLLQFSRFDRFKDPIGVIKAYRMVKKYNDCLLVLAGSPASDDPEGAAVLREVKEYAAGDPDIHVLLLPPFSDRDVNGLQRLAAVILQKSLKEGFGLTVSEAMWKAKPVIGGAVGGIPIQIVDGQTGFLVHSIDGAAFRIRQLLNNSDMGRRMGENAREYVRNNFLITRQVRDYLALWYSLENAGRHLLEM
jgi:trehalose synthase